MTKYYSKSKQKFIEIANMPDQYVRNAFVKMCKHEPTEDAIFGQQQKERADKYKKLAEDNFISGVGDLDEREKLTEQVTELKKQLNSTTYQPYDKQGRVRDYQVEFTKLARERDKWKEKSMNMIEKSTHEDKLKETISKCNTRLANAMPLESWKKINNQCEELQLENVRLVAQLEHDEHNVGKLDDTVSKDAYQVMWDNCQVLQNERAKLLKESNELKDQMQTYRDRNAVLSRMYNASLSSNQKLEEDYKYVNDRMMNYATMLNNKCPKGDVKMFSEIPNTDDGWEFVGKLKRYLNKESYKIRVRGQYLDDETKKTEGWQRYSWGQPIEKSKCLRVYVDINNDK